MFGAFGGLIAGGSTVTGGGSTVTGGGSTGGETVTVPGGTTVSCVSVGLMTTVGEVVVVVVVVVVVSPASSPSPQAATNAPVLTAATARMAGGHAFRFVMSTPLFYPVPSTRCRSGFIACNCAPQ
jgi:hypothetical protein